MQKLTIYNENTFVSIKNVFLDFEKTTSMRFSWKTLLIKQIWSDQTQIYYRRCIAARLLTSSNMIIQRVSGNKRSLQSSATSFSTEYDYILQILTIFKLVLPWYPKIRSILIRKSVVIF